MSAAEDRLKDLEEGSDCPTGCGGQLEVSVHEDCTCFSNPPCWHCVEDILKCSECGWRLPDGLPEADEPAPGGAS